MNTNYVTNAIENSDFQDKENSFEKVKKFFDMQSDMSQVLVLIYKKMKVFVYWGIMFGLIYQ